MRLVAHERLTLGYQKAKFETAKFELQSLLQQSSLTAVPLLVVSLHLLMSDPSAYFRTAREQE